MPFYRGYVAQELENKKSEFRGPGLHQAAIEEYQDVASDLPQKFSKTEIEDELEDLDNPSALPTGEYADFDGLVVPFEEASDWGSHEAVNNWARENIEDVTTVAADGSQIDPVNEFEKPVGLVQVVWISNNHSSDGDYREDVEVEVLSPEDVLFENPNSGHIQVDDQEVPATRFETEMKVLAEKVVEHSDDENPPVVLYDGSLILSFIQKFDGPTQQRYGDALAELLAASKHHGVPVAGYIAGSKATELSRMIDKLGLVDTDQVVRDYRFLQPLMDNWGDRTVLFGSRRDQTLNQLQVDYRGTSYDFSESILFTYLRIGSSQQLDRVELPKWVYEECLVDYVLSVIRAEAGVGRGYPEILQAVDADAVISRQDREEFLRMYQDFSEENDIELEWDNKALSKKRRRR